ncbi:MAG: LEA type 2 family protein [Candidatus Aminicenantes bacterium]|nr:LEA type 2 family protein [Candidatus Aminicenantes bacterium]
MIKRLPAAVVLIVLAGGIGTAGQKAADPAVLVKDKRIVEATSQGLTLVFRLILRNPSSAAIRLVRYDYRAVVDETEYLNIQVPLEYPILVEARDETLISLPVRLSYINLFPAVPGLADKDLAFCYVAGGMTFQDERKRDKRIMIAFSSDFPVYRGLDFIPIPVEVRSLTIGGAEISTGFAVENRNGFSFTLDSLTYSLELAGYRAIAGETGAGTKVEAKGRKAFSFPLILDFFETGAAVADGLNASSLEVRVAGEAEFTTPWGPWKTSFDRNLKVGAVKK